MRLEIDAAGADAEVVEPRRVFVGDPDPLSLEGDVLFLARAVKDGADLAPLALLGVGDVEARNALGQILDDGDVVGGHGSGVHERRKRLADLHQAVVVADDVAEGVDVLPVDHIFLA